MKKRRQHHVWQRYLKSWAVDDQIYWLKDGAIFATNTTNVAVERDFYKLQKLTPADFALIENLIIAPAHPLAQRNHENLLMQFTLPARFVEENRDQLRNLEKIEELLDVEEDSRFSATIKRENRETSSTSSNSSIFSRLRSWSLFS